MAQRCQYCGRTEKQHGGIVCFSVSGSSWVGQNMTGGAKPPRKPTTKKEPKK